MTNPCEEAIEERDVYVIVNRRSGRRVAVYSMDREGELEFRSEAEARNCFASGRFLDKDKYDVIKTTRYYAKEYI